MQRVLFRSRTQQGVLAVLYLEGDQAHPWTIRQLAERIGASEAAVSREVTRLAGAGLVAERRAGNQRLVRPVTTGPVARHLTGLLRALVGPEVVLRRLLIGRDDVDRALVFGSYAARAAGEPGSLPGDIDLLVVGDIDPRDAYDLADQASRETGMEVNPVVRTADEWDRDDTGFAAQLRDGPTIDLLT